MWWGLVGFFRSFIYVALTYCILSPDCKLPKDDCSLLIALTEVTGVLGDVVISLSPNEL